MIEFINKMLQKLVWQFRVEEVRAKAWGNKDEIDTLHDSMDARMDELYKNIDSRLDNMYKNTDKRVDELSAKYNESIAYLRGRLDQVLGTGSK